MKVNKWINNIQSFFYPPSCMLCGSIGQVWMERDAQGIDLCSGCHSALPINEHACVQCGIPFDTELDETTCGQCQRVAPAFDRCLALYRYEAPMDTLITRLKFHHRLAIARLLSTLMQGKIRNLDPLPEAILPVPLHPSRLRERGFNQALEIARPIARALHIPLLLHECERTRATVMQSSLPAKQRSKNVKGVFRVSRAIPYQHIAIIDDVMTTGQTVGELAKVLRAAGVPRIDVWVVARAQLK